MEEFVGKELDPLTQQASDKFLFDDNFVKEREFLQFLWRIHIGEFKNKCQQKKQPSRGKEEIQNEIKQVMISRFEKITP